MYLDAHIWCGRTDEAERRADVHTLDDVPSVVGRCVQHAVECEARVVYDVVQLAVLPTRLQSACEARQCTREREHALDRSIEDALREVVRGDVSTDRDGVAAKGLDLVDNLLCLLLFEAVGRWSGSVGTLVSITYSVTTTFAPSFA